MLPWHACHGMQRRMRAHAPANVCAHNAFDEPATCEKNAQVSMSIFACVHDTQQLVLGTHTHTHKPNAAHRNARTRQHTASNCSAQGHPQRAGQAIVCNTSSMEHVRIICVPCACMFSPSRLNTTTTNIARRRSHANAQSRNYRHRFAFTCLSDIPRERACSS